MIPLRDFILRHRAASLLVLLCLLVAAATLAMSLSSSAETSRGAKAPEPTSGPLHGPQRVSQAEAPSPERLSASDRDALHASIARLRSMPRMQARTSPGHQPIRGPASRQADLYAAEFTRRLLTQDYRTSRSNLLAWVQAESAQSKEPRVVGLVPPKLRPKLAVASVQEGFNGPGPVPSQGVWDVLAGKHGHTSVVIQRVTEPVAWSAAVANGTISDPGVTARAVDAELTLHTKVNGQERTERYSVSMTMNLEGPPVHEGYGLVTVVRYTSVKVPSS